MFSKTHVKVKIEEIEGLENLVKSQKQEIERLKKIELNDDLFFMMENNYKKISLENEELKAELQELQRKSASALALESAYLGRISELKSQKDCEKYRTKSLEVYV